MFLVTVSVDIPHKHTHTYKHTHIHHNHEQRHYVNCTLINRNSLSISDLSGSALACWDYGFESHRLMDICLLWVLCVVR